jgi:hypothetical protein
MLKGRHTAEFSGTPSVPSGERRVVTSDGGYGLSGRHHILWYMFANVSEVRIDSILKGTTVMQASGSSELFVLYYQTIRRRIRGSHIPYTVFHILPGSLFTDPAILTHTF